MSRLVNSAEEMVAARGVIAGENDANFRHGHILRFPRL